MKNYILILFAVLISGAASASDQPDHSIWDRFLHDHVSSSGKVDYKGMKKVTDTLDSYLVELRDHVPDANWSKNEKLAYYINAYNAFTIKFVLAKYPVKSVKDISFSGKDIWNFRMVQLGDKRYTLNQVENDILRKMNEPRIHFAINCASVSCPKLYNHAFVPEKMNSQLNKVTKEFINDPTRNEISEKKVKLCEIFSWYKEDFEKPGQTLIDYINQYSEVKISPKAKIEYLPYDWSLNE